MNRAGENGSRTVGRLARLYGLSRSTLLYYDSLGLLKPAARASGDYRRYGPEERARLARILEYRDLGFSLEEIARLLEARTDSLESVLLGRLDSLGAEAAAIGRKRSAIVAMLKSLGAEKPGRATAALLDPASLTAILESAGVDREARTRFHAAFEHSAPEAHRAFLEYIGMGESDIAALLNRCKTKG